MKRTALIMLAAILLAVLAAVARAANPGTNIWAGGYPKAGQQAGTMLVKGTATAETGYTLTGTGFIVYWPQGGGQPVSQAITVNADGTWGETTVSGLTTGTTYNVFVQAGEQAGVNVFTLGTDPSTVKAP